MREEKAIQNVGKSGMRVSVIIPTYNRLSQTRRAIDSAVAQTYPVHEILVIDDASHPSINTSELEAVDPRVRVHALPVNQGAAAARQKAVDLSTGDILAFLDSDDVWHPHKLERQLTLLNDDSLVAIACGWSEIAANGDFIQKRIPIEATSPLDFLSGCWFCPGSTVIMTRSSFCQIGPFDTELRRLEDYEWFARFGLAGGRLLVLSEVQASISVGARARLLPVQSATARIRCHLLSAPDMTPSMGQRVRSWLDVELARAALNERRIVPFLRYIVSSLWHQPRLSTQLREWWR